MRLVAIARCLPGLEQLLIQELEGVGIAPMVMKNTIEKNSNKNNAAITTNPIALGGLISFPTTQAELFRCHAQLGIPTSILLRCSTADTTFTAKGLAELRRKVSKMNMWNDLLVAAPNNREGERPLAMRIHVTSYKSKLYHTQAVAERIEQGIYDAMSLGPISQDGASASASQQDQRRPIHIRVTIIRDQVHIFLDTSSYGIPLHQRGYRLETAKAPLREDIAQALVRAGLHEYMNKLPNNKDRLLLSKKNSTLIIFDPFCGSGTIPIEASASVTNLLPGRLRAPPLLGTTLYDEKLWERTLLSLSTASRGHGLGMDTNLKVLASDRDNGAIQSAKRNAQRAGVEELIDFNCYSVSEAFDNLLSYMDSTPGDEHCHVFIITNPPFGKRISTSFKGSASQKDLLLPLYQTLGKNVNRIKNVNVGLIVNDVRLARQTGVPNLKLQFITHHGGLPVSCLLST